MPEPTTRRGRYLHRQQKYLHRWRRRHNAGKKGTGSPGYGTPPARQFPLYSVGNDGRVLQGLPGLKTPQGNHPIPLRYIDPWYPWTIDGGGYATPPHSHWPLNPWTFTLNSHWPIGMIGLHRKRVPYAGHKVGRLDGFNWLCARARQYFLQHGEEFYPTWDPLHREPQET